MEKSHVTMEQAMCPICTKKFDTGAILLDKRLRKRFESSTLTKWDICAECKKQIDDDRIAFVGADYDKSTKLPNGNVNPDGAYRTGEILFIRKTAAQKIFNVPLADLPFCFIEPEAIQKIKEMMEN